MTGRGVATRTATRTSGIGEPRLAGPSLVVAPVKLEPPFHRPGIIDRPRLRARLDVARTPMIALIAPAGYGKSTFLAQTGRGADGPVAWLSADAHDGDPASLLRDLAAAIDRVAPLDPETVAAITGPGPSLWSVCVPRLQAAMAAIPDLTLAIDDVDRIDQPDAVDIVVAVARSIGATGRVIIAGRTVGEVPAAKLVAEGLLTIVDRDDLALDPSEAADLLAAAGVRLEPAEVAALNERTEGWATGIYLSALAADRGHGPVTVSAVAPDRLVEEYLRSEVLGRLEPDDVRLLLGASVLDRMSGPLCDTILERSRSGAALDRLERTNLFLVPLDRDRTWYRFHHLFGDLLRAELERRDPAAATEYRRRAAIWYEHAGDAEAALEYAMAAGDEARAAALTIGIGQAVLNAGRTATVRRWATWFDERGAAARLPHLAAYTAMVFALEGDAARAERWADMADAAPDDPRAPGHGVRMISRVLQLRHGVDGMRHEAEAALEIIPESDPWHVAALTSVGLTRQLDGDVASADQVFTRAVARWEATRVANIAATMALIQLAANALERGDRGSAGEAIRRARAILVANGLAEHAVAMGVDGLAARLALAHGVAERARADVAHAQRLRPRLGYAVPWLALRARFDLVRAHLGLGDPGGARTLLAEADDILVLRPAMGSLLGERDELVRTLASVGGGQAGASTLTMAELRVLPLLTTHLTFREIGERLFVSQNTVKTQAISIYRKLEASSRSEAIERAVALGLIESGPSREQFIPPG